MLLLGLFLVSGKILAEAKMLGEHSEDQGVAVYGARLPKILVPMETLGIGVVEDGADMMVPAET